VYRHVQALGRGSTEQRSCRSGGAWPSKTELLQDCVGLRVISQLKGDVCVCISSMAGLVGKAWQNRAPAGLCRPWGMCGLVEIINVCGSPAFRASMEILPL
jgi:hypothetical protein